MSSDTNTESPIQKETLPAASEAGQIRLKRVLVAVDFSDTSRKAARYARQFAEMYGARVLLFHVVDFTDIDRVALRLGPLAQERMESEALTRARESAAEIAETELGSGVENECDIVTGLASHAIVEKAAQWQADLIFVGTHSERKLRHAIIGSTAERVVRHSPCPVLVVRDKEHEFIAT